MVTTYRGYSAVTLPGRYRFRSRVWRGSCSWPAYASGIVAADYFRVETWNLKRFHILCFVELGRRRIVTFGVTANPNQAWVSQQVRNLCWRAEDLGPRRSVLDLRPR